MNALPRVPGNRPHFSPKSIGIWEDCNTAFQFSYSLKAELQPPSFARCFGSAMHRVAESDSKNKIGGAGPLSADEAKEVFRFNFKRQLDRAKFSLTDISEFGNERIAVKELMLQGLACARMWAVQISPCIIPIAAEKPFRLPVPERTYDYVGRIDLIARPGRLVPASITDALRSDKQRDSMRVLADLKFGRARQPMNVHGSHQLTMYYGAHAYVFNGSTPDLLAILQLKRSTRGPSWKIGFGIREPNDFAKLVDYTDMIADAADAGHYPPTGLSTGHCDKRFCDFHDICTARLREPASIQTEGYTDPVSALPSVTNDIEGDEQ